MKYIGHYAGDLCIKVTHKVNDNTLPFSDVKEQWESNFNSLLEDLIKQELSNDVADIEVVLIQDYAILETEGDDHASEKLQH